MGLEGEGSRLGSWGFGPQKFPGFGFRVYSPVFEV